MAGQAVPPPTPYTLPPPVQHYQMCVNNVSQASFFAGLSSGVGAYYFVKTYGSAKVQRPFNRVAIVGCTLTSTLANHLKANTEFFIALLSGYHFTVTALVATLVVRRFGEDACRVKYAHELQARSK